eukprot:m.202586 g.202586  ORF g.202586 m.202586 type:complete len:564 (-) comp32833_c0_seq1:439-2130(-)
MPPRQRVRQRQQQTEPIVDEKDNANLSHKSINGNVTLMLTACAIFIAVVVATRLSSSPSAEPLTPSHEDVMLSKELSTDNPYALANTQAGANDALAWLLQPLDSNEFFREHWETKPVVLRRRESFYNDLESGLEFVDAVLTTQRKVERTPLLMHPTQGTSQADCSTVKNSMENETHKYTNLYHAYLNGATLVCNIVPAYWGPLATLMGGLSKETGFQWLSNLYLSPRGAQGFPSHTDNKDGLVVQVTGKKRWVIHESKFVHPLRSQMLGRPHERGVEDLIGKTITNTEISQGDLIHIPRGFIHHALTSDEPSLHYTISATKNFEWCDFLTSFCKNVVTDDDDETKILEMIQMAIDRETKLAKNSWIRASLPLFYSTDRTQLLESLSPVLTKLKKSTLKHAARALKRIQNWKEKVDTVFSRLETGDDKAIEAALVENAVYTNYVQSLIDHGLSTTSEGVLRIEGALQQDTSFVLVTRKDEDACAFNFKSFQPDDDGSVTLLTATSTDPSVVIKYSSNIQNILRFIQATQFKSFFLKDIPSDDAFETACVLRLALYRGALNIVTE